MIASDVLFKLVAATMVAFVIFLGTATWELFRLDPSSAPTLRGVLYATIQNPALWVLGIPAFYGAFVYLAQIA